ncbi:hypothetical protein Ocin01_12041 [Orchesella cincta]|uniref:Uncharacterized protein n=1 Tax=Orchesella cincta TaxID=48709 RepID=A0A1D2MPA9_ORCCI|nr:hypothetical protein Ocin01_12041 [Orchesella cincta]
MLANIYVSRSSSLGKQKKGYCSLDSEYEYDYDLSFERRGCVVDDLSDKRLTFVADLQTPHAHTCVEFYKA